MCVKCGHYHRNRFGADSAESHQQHTRCPNAILSPPSSLLPPPNDLLPKPSPSLQGAPLRRRLLPKTSSLSVWHYWSHTSSNAITEFESPHHDNVTWWHHRPALVKKHPQSPQPFESAVSHRVAYSSIPQGLMSDTFWSDACRKAEGRPLQTVLDATYTSCGVTVRRAPAPLLPFALRAAALSPCNAWPSRLRRIVRALWWAGGCCICGG